MPKKPIIDDRPRLRAAAEARFARAPRAPHEMSSPLLHELQVHQIELEMQNDELRRDQLEIEAAHERYLDLYDFAPVGYLTLDDKGLIASANLTAAALLGKERRALVGRRFAGFVGHGDADRWHHFSQALAQSDERRGCRLALGRPDGPTFDGALVCERRRDAGGATQVRIVLTDISEFATLERALRETKERLSFVIDGSNDGFWDVDVPSGVVKFSRGLAQMLGYDLAELEPSLSTWDGMVHPDDRQKSQAERCRYLDGDVAQLVVESRVRHKDGHWVWVLVRGKAVERDARGNPSRMTGTTTDISDRKLAAQALAESEERYRNLVNGLAEGLIVQGADGGITTCNPAGERLLGLVVDEENIRSSIAPEWEAVHADGSPFPGRDHPAMVALRTGEPQLDVTMGVRKADGSTTWISMSAEPIRDVAGQVRSARSTFLDITARRKAEAERNSLQARVALASRLAAMGTLVTGVAHEINNPLAAALADQELALDAVKVLRDRLQGSDPIDRSAEARSLDAVAEELTDAQHGGRRIEQIVKDLSAFGRPDAKRARLRLMDVVDQAMRWLPASVGQAATIHVQNGGAPDVLASFGQIQQVVVNLVNNAAKATRQGHPGAIVIRLVPGDPGMARLDVIDEGTGIDPEMQERIFEPFFTNSVVGQGMGLGLSICHAIVTAHGGTLTATSKVGQGSTFRMELPMAPAASC